MLRVKAPVSDRYPVSDHPTSFQPYIFNVEHPPPPPPRGALPYIMCILSTLEPAPKPRIFTLEPLRRPPPPHFSLCRGTYLPKCGPSAPPPPRSIIIKQTYTILDTHCV